jgi:hypothetical protein
MDELTRMTSKQSLSHSEKRKNSGSQQSHPPPAHAGKRKKEFITPLRPGQQVEALLASRKKTGVVPAKFRIAATKHRYLIAS